MTMTQDSARPVTVRFAPSPTGYLHIGGARTALFNWLYARHTGGRYLLRIEDTDRQRSTEAATEALLQGLAWLGLDWDGDAVSQFARVDRHKEVAYQLLEKGAAYKCFATAEELAQFREAHPYEKYQSPWRNVPPSEHPDAPCSIRVKAPQESEDIIEIVDQVQGSVRVKAGELDDFIILRSDGTPTYLLAVVVDDHDMGITHVIRGDDHLTNTFRQNLIYQGMGWDIPVYAHVPMIHGADGAKLSKRHGALGVHEYERLGYLPEALCNYLLRLGWSHGDDEIISRDQAIEWFNLDSINKAPGRLDVQKLDSVNAHYIKEADNDRLITLVLNDAKERDLLKVDEETAVSRLKTGINDLKSRVKTILQLTDEADFYLKNTPLHIEDAARNELTNASNILENIEKALSTLSSWQASELEIICKAVGADHAGGKMPLVYKPLRAALTGRTNSPSLPTIMEALGKDETLSRIQAARQV